MRYVVIGAGAIGGSLAGRLGQHSAAHHPLLIARGENGSAIAAHGLRLRAPDEDTRVHVSVAAGPDDVRLADDDVLVLATKTQQAREALEQWVDRPVYRAGPEGGAARLGDPVAREPIGTAGERLPILTALNGVESERLALRLFERVFGVCVWLPAVHLTAGEVLLRIAPVSGVFTMGRAGSAADEQDRRLLETVAADWRAASFRVHIADDVMRWKYAKLLSNLLNAVQALIGPAARADELRTAIRAEAEEVLLAAGIEWTSREEEATRRGSDFRPRPVPGDAETMGGSTWQSLARRSGSVETDYLNGEIAYLARSHGVRAPLNSGIQRLARQAARERWEPGSMSVSELTHRIMSGF